MKDFIKVYIYDRDDIKNNYFIPAWRRKEIKGAHPFEKDDKKNIWGALTYAVKDCFGAELESLHPHKLPTGKLVLDNCHVSLSHSGSKLLVVISNQNVGGDIIKISEGRYGALASHTEFWSPCELNEIEEKKTKDRDIYFKLWTQKEALYKYLDPGHPFKESNEHTIDTSKYKEMFYTTMMKYDEYYFSVCSDLIKHKIIVG